MIDRQWWEHGWCHLLIILLSTLPLLYPIVPVWGDMPAHLGLYRVALDHADPGSPLHQYYQFGWKMQGNMGVDVVVMLLCALLPLELAAKLALVLTIALTSAGLLAVSREVHGRVSPMALFAVPLSYSFTFQFGMANYCLSIGLAFCGFALWLNLGRRGWQFARGLIFLLGCPLLWICHIYGWAVLCVLCVMTELGQNLRRGNGTLAAIFRTLRATLVLATPLALTLVWRSGGADFASGWFDFEEKISFLLHALSAVWPFGEIKSIIIKIAVLMALAFALMRQRRWTLHRDMRPAIVMLGLLFVLLPTTLFGSYAADGRLFPYIIMLMLLSFQSVGRVDEKFGARCAIWGLGFMLIQLFAFTITFALTAEAQEQRMRVLAQVPRGARLVSFVGGGDFCDDHEYNRVMNHLPSMAIVRRRAFANDQFQNDQLMRVIYPAAKRNDPSATTAEPRDYFHDESQLVYNPLCTRSSFDAALVALLSPNHGHDLSSKYPDMRSIDYTLRHLPRDKFDYVWLIAPPAIDPDLLRGMTRIAGDTDSALYRISSQR
jgi:hypothetical protein